MGIFGKSSDVAKAMDIYNKAQKGTLKAIMSKGNNEDTEVCIIQLNKNKDGSYSIDIKVSDNEKYHLELAD